MQTAQELISWLESLGGKIYLNNFDTQSNIVGPLSVMDAQNNHFTFIGVKMKGKVKELIQACSSDLILVENELQDEFNPEDFQQKCFVFVENPKDIVIEYARKFTSFYDSNEKTKIDDSSKIHSSVQLGNNVVIGPNVVIEKGCVIRDNSIIEANSIIKSETRIGQNVKIGSNCVIGGVGFGYQKAESGEFERFPHFGSVIIKNDVSIGSNTCIDRGSLSNTVLENGVKVDNLVHIAHNVKIGKNSLIIANAMIAGSVEIGENCWVAPSSSIRNGVRIGNNVTIGLASLVTKNIEDNQVVTGSPAVPLTDFKKMRTIQQDLMKNYQIK